MEIIKSKLFIPRKCEFGDFELKPEEGWKISQSFIDFESKLLIVSVSIIDESKWTDNDYNGRSIPTKDYKIDLKSLQILNCDEWRTYFNYNKKETISDDKKYKLITQRVFEPKRNSDGIKEELYDLKSDKLISSSDSIAFRENKRENLLESLYRSIQEREEQKRILDAKPTLEEFYKKQLDELKDNEDILCYFDNINTYKLTFSNFKFVLSEGGKLPSEYEGWKSMKFTTVKTYYNLDEFWQDFITDEKWFLKFRVHKSISQRPLIFAKDIITYFNNLRKEHKFTFDEYDRINEWSNNVWSDDYKRTEIKQWCSNCYKEVYYQGRYPKYICGECASKNKFDNEGNLLEFSNLGFSGGFKIIYKDAYGSILKEDDTQQFCDCIIDDKLFFAQEARFGGIIIQKKE